MIKQYRYLKCFLNNLYRLFAFYNTITPLGLYNLAIREKEFHFFTLFTYIHSFKILGVLITKQYQEYQLHSQRYSHEKHLRISKANIGIIIFDTLSRKVHSNFNIVYGTYKNMFAISR